MLGPLHTLHHIFLMCRIEHTAVSSCAGVLLLDQQKVHAGLASHTLACPWEEHLAARCVAECAPVLAAGGRRSHL
jgi:hypothetical protein